MEYHRWIAAWGWLRILVSRNSHPQRSLKKAVLKNFANFTGKHFFSLFLLIKNEICNFIKKRLWRRCFHVDFGKFIAAWGLQRYEKRLWHRNFPVNFVKVLRIPFLQNISRQLLLLWSSAKLRELTNLTSNIILESQR